MKQRPADLLQRVVERLSPAFCGGLIEATA